MKLPRLPQGLLLKKRRVILAIALVAVYFSAAFSAWSIWNREPSADTTACGGATQEIQNFDGVEFGTNLSSIPGWSGQAQVNPGLADAPFGTDTKYLWVNAQTGTQISHAIRTTMNNASFSFKFRSFAPYGGGNPLIAGITGAGGALMRIKVEFTGYSYDIYYFDPASGEYRKIRTATNENAGGNDTLYIHWNGAGYAVQYANDRSGGVQTLAENLPLLTNQPPQSFFIDAPYGTVLDAFSYPVGSDKPCPSPTVNIKANDSDGPITVNLNTDVNISWSSTDATQCAWKIDDGNLVPTQLNVSNVKVGANKAITTVHVECSNPYGWSDDNVLINGVTTTIPAPTVTFSASPTSIHKGQSATLTWNTTGAASVTIDNGVGAVSASSSTTVSPTDRTTYTITATNAAGVSQQATVTIDLIFDAPTATVTGPATIRQGDKGTFSLTAADSNNDLTQISLHRSPVSKDEWTTINSPLTCSGGTCTGSIDWTPTDPPGEYNVVINAYDASNLKCSGNAVNGTTSIAGTPLTPNTWTDCGTQSRIKVTVTGPFSVLGVGTVCSSTEASQATTETFESFTDGQNKDFGWYIWSYPNTTAVIKKTIGKTGNGLELVDTNSNSGVEFMGNVSVGRQIRAAETGSISFDVKPAQANGQFGFSMRSQKDNFLFLVLDKDGKVKRYTKDKSYVAIGSAIYKANEWLNIKIDWTQAGFDLTLNGTKVTSATLPFSYPENVGSVISFNLNTGDNQSPSHTGSYVVDNVVYPGCGNSLSLSVSPTTGTAPLKVTAIAGLPNVNLLNQVSTELNDVDGPVDNKLTQTRNKDGALEISGVPLATECKPKSWLFDLDQSRGNQLQFKRTVPENASIDAKISWETSDAGMMQGMIGLIDKDGYIHDMVGFNDSAGSGGANGGFGVLLAQSRNYKKDAFKCGDNKPTDTFKAIGNNVIATGSANLRIVKNGKHIKLMIDGQIIQEHDITGDSAGIAIITDGLPGSPFGKFKVENLTLTDLTLNWDYGDGKTETNQNTTVEHTYEKAGAYTIKVVNGEQGAQSGVKAMTVNTVIIVDPPNPNPAPAKQDLGAAMPTSTDTSKKDSGDDSGDKGIAKVVKLASTGGSLVVNLMLAVLLALGTTYLLLRKTKHK